MSSDQRYLLHIRDAILLIQRRTQAGREQFLLDLDQQDAVLWRLFTLSDAAAQLSDEIKARHPEIPWTRIRGFRNVAAHGYLELLIDLTWEIVEHQLPELLVVVEEELGGG